MSEEILEQSGKISRKTFRVFKLCKCPEIPKSASWGGIKLVTTLSHLFSIATLTGHPVKTRLNVSDGALNIEPCNWFSQRGGQKGMDKHLPGVVVTTNMHFYEVL